MDYAAPVESTDAQSDSLKKSSYEIDQEQLAETQGRVEELIAVNELENQLETQMTSEGLLITIRDSVLFASGSANINAEYAGVARELSEILAFNPARNVVITGHTDNVPMNTSEFESNWELSVLRAVNFLKIIVVDSNC